MATETELKLLLQPSNTAQFLAHPLLQQAAHTRLQQRLHNTYYDTPTAALRQHKIALRVRHKADVWLQTIKSAGQTQAGLHQRAEWEVPIANQHLDFSRFPAEALTGILADAQIKQKVQAIFTTDFQRTTWQLSNAAGDQLELCLDQGQVQHGNDSLPIHEIELELIQGAPRYLYQTALQLIQTVPLVLENDSKAQRGYQLMGFNPVVSTAAEVYHAPKTKDNTLIFQHLLQYTLRQIHRNQAAAQQGDAESFHCIVTALNMLNSFPDSDASRVLQADCQRVSAHCHDLLSDKKQADAALFQSVAYNRLLLNLGYLQHVTP